MEQDAPPLRTMRDVWDLIIGPEASPWSSLLVQDHLGSEGRLALFQTCRGGRDMVLTTAQQATLKVTANLEGPAITKALVTRGNLPTKLHLAATDSEQLLQMLGALEEGTTRLDELQVEGDGLLPRHVLAIVGHCCPNLRALDVRAAMDQLPSHDLFPNLKMLSITDPTWYTWLQGEQRQLHSQRVRLAAAPYIKHLTHLTMWTNSGLPFSPANVATHLRSLDLLHTTLDDALLGLILQCAPAVEQLAMRKMALQSDAHVHTLATWRQLEYYYDGGLRLSSLARLPVTAPGLLLVGPRGADRIITCDTDILDDAAVARLREKQFRWDGDDDHLYLERKVDGVDNAAALRLALSLLRSWVKADGNPFSGVSMTGCWTMTQELMVELHTGLPPWQRLFFESSITWVPEEPHLYVSLLRLLPNSYREVTFSCMSDCDGLLMEHGLTNEQVVSICCGAPERTAEAPLHITLADCLDERFEAIQHLMQLSLIPNVVVVRGY